MTAKAFRRPQSLFPLFTRKGGAAPTATHYCPGCGHGVVHKLLAEAMDILGIRERTILISPVGCAVFAYHYFNCGNIQSAHGRAPAVGTGVSRCRDDAVVVSYQGDGDLASIGLNETLQAANRGERLAVIFINNTVYGMTGGQMAPTTMEGEVTSTCPRGRDPRDAGYPIHMCELIDRLRAPIHIERVSVSDIAHIRKARQAILKALEIQRDAKGYAFVEVLSNCPTNLRQSVQASADFVNREMEREFPLGRFRDKSAEAASCRRPDRVWDKEALDRLYGLDKVAPDAPENPDWRQIGVKISGFGGQGVLSLGLILANAACQARRHTSWYPSYGPEQRGGTANCSVQISGSGIGSPVVAKPDVLVALNRPSLERFALDLKPDGLILYDDAIEGAKLPAGAAAHAVPARALASEAGNLRAANTVMLGALSAFGVTGLEREFFLAALDDNFAGKPKLIGLNRQAFGLAEKWAAGLK
ncbi:MAG: 2-oxoacid:acceptor oxidoreductase family protein [Planctomycetota bacterium]|jgi:2-oxoisovalerate ferredoxin oxidoreductase beta subunit|nr:2-oxoacid:acceptor oxidoreductase family protein [Planctomycetota bacterium]